MIRKNILATTIFLWLIFNGSMFWNAYAAILSDERTALVELYNSTNGDNWIKNTDWLGEVGTECTWYGVTCDAGGNYVMEITLASNNLDGAIPDSVESFTNLESLDLKSNRLTGSVPAELTGLSNLISSQSDFRWNALYTSEPALQLFIGNKQIGGDWQSTQTVAPTDLTAGTPTSTSIMLSWEAIDYTAGNGGYEIYYSTTSGGPYTLFSTTSGKDVKNMTVTGLTSGTTYYFRLRTVTEPHTENNNLLYSEYSNEISEKNALSDTSNAHPWSGIRRHQCGNNGSL